MIIIIAIIWFAFFISMKTIAKEIFSLKNYNLEYVNEYTLMARILLSIICFFYIIAVIFDLTN